MKSNAERRSVDDDDDVVTVQQRGPAFQSRQPPGAGATQGAAQGAALGAAADHQGGMGRGQPLRNGAEGPLARPPSAGGAMELPLASKPPPGPPRQPPPTRPSFDDDRLPSVQGTARLGGPPGVAQGAGQQPTASQPTGQPTGQSNGQRESQQAAHYNTHSNSNAPLTLSTTSTKEFGERSLGRPADNAFSGPAARVDDRRPPQSDRDKWNPEVNGPDQSNVESGKKSDQPERPLPHTTTEKSFEKRKETDVRERPPSAGGVRTTSVTNGTSHKIVERAASQQQQQQQRLFNAQQHAGTQQRSKAHGQVKIVQQKKQTFPRVFASILR